MNAASSSPAGSAAMTVPAPVKSGRTNAFAMLLRREYWENRGGFLWAPLIAGAIFLLLSVMGLVVGEMAAHRMNQNTVEIHDAQGVHRITSEGSIEVNGQNVAVNGLNLSKLTSKMSPTDMRELGNVIDMSLYGAAIWPFIVLSFVVFFYCLGSLYDDRKDRSVMFWKSLPISDSATVLSKAASATLFAPILAVLAAIATMFGFLILSSAVVMFHGGNPITLLWGPGSPLKVAFHLLASLPIYAFWALPTVGWLMLCSAWAKSKPFLWAIMLPVFAGIFVYWFHLMQLFDLDAGWFWRHVVGRVLLSASPGSHMVLSDGVMQFARLAHGPEAFSQVMSLKNAYAVFATADMWIGVAAGAAMIFAAIRLRRWRDDS